MPSARGPAPIYCSPAHRQSAYRQRRRDEGLAPGEPTPRPSLREEFEALQQTLREVSDATSWAAARRILADAVEKDPRIGEREKP